MKNIFMILIFTVSIIFTSCNNIFLDDLIDNSITPNLSIPVSDSISIDGSYQDWDNIPILLRDESDESMATGNIIEFKMAKDSSGQYLYFYFRTVNSINIASESYIVTLSNDLMCDGKRLVLTSGAALLWELCNNTQIAVPSGTLNWPYNAPTVAANQLEGLVNYHDVVNGVYNDVYFPQNEKIFISIYSVLFASSVYPPNDIVKGAWLKFR